MTKSTNQPTDQLNTQKQNTQQSETVPPPRKLAQFILRIQGGSKPYTCGLVTMWHRPTAFICLHFWLFAHKSQSLFPLQDK